MRTTFRTFGDLEQLQYVCVSRHLLNLGHVCYSLGRRSRLRDDASDGQLWDYKVDNDTIMIINNIIIIDNIRSTSVTGTDAT